jgi:hypothetical protein
VVANGCTNNMAEVAASRTRRSVLYRFRSPPNVRALDVGNRANRFPPLYVDADVERPTMPPPFGLPMASSMIAHHGYDNPRDYQLGKQLKPCHDGA